MTNRLVVTYLPDEIVGNEKNVYRETIDLSFRVGMIPFMMFEHCTMDDIARECGLSKKTVSRVFTDSAAVKDTTRQKVLKVAKRFNYEVNVMARNLSQNQSGFIGLAAPLEAMLGGNYFAAFFNGVRRAIPDDAGFTFALFDTCSESFNDGTKLAKLYRQRRVDGLLVVALHTHDQFVGTLEQIHVPMVIVGEKSPNRSVCSVFCDDELGIGQLCSHLYSLGHRRIAYVQGPPEYATSHRRKRAFLEFLDGKKIKNPPEYIQEGDFTPRGGRAAALRLLQAQPRPTAIMVGNDTMAIAIIETLRAHKLRVPEDISVTGFDDDPGAGECSPTLTTAHQPIIEMGELGARKLLHAMQSEVMSTESVTMKPALVIRESTGAAASMNRHGLRQQKPLRAEKAG